MLPCYLLAISCIDNHNHQVKGRIIALNNANICLPFHLYSFSKSLVRLYSYYRSLCIFITFSHYSQFTLYNQCHLKIYSDNASAGFFHKQQ